MCSSDLVKSVQYDRVQFAMDAAKDGIWDWNTVTNAVYFSPRYISMLGYTEEEFPPEVDSWLKRIHPDDKEKTAVVQFQYIENPALGDVFECVYRFLAADGNYKWILGRGQVTKRDNNGRADRIVGVHTDIIELHETQDNLQE